MTLFSQSSMPLRQASVGFSDGRTPVKHRLQDRFQSKEVFAAPHVAMKYNRIRPPVFYPGHTIVDLTAGDGIGDGKNTFWKSASPLISAKIAASQHDVRLRLYERDVAAFQSLMTVLEQHLPSIGFQRIGETEWVHSVYRSTINAFCGDARAERFDLKPHEWLFVLNDPNNMHGWVLDMKRLAAVMSEPQGGGPRFATFMSTMGCNAGGLKMLPLEHRKMWFKHIEQAIEIIGRHTRLDLVLFRILNDAAQWAYLLMVPKVWTEKTITEYRVLFEKERLTVGASSWWRDHHGFTDAISTSFFTETERANGAVWKI